MNETLAERLCTSRHRWLIVTGVTFVIALASVMPQVDLLLAERSERADLNAQLAEARQTATQLPLYEERVAEKAAELDALRGLEVDEAHVAQLRSWLVNAAREAGCQVRRIDLSPAQVRSWSDDDDPLAPPSKENLNKDTPYHLHTRTVALSVTGTTAEVRALLKTLDADPRLKHTHAIDLRPEGRNNRKLQLDLTLWYFALAPPAGVV